MKRLGIGILMLVAGAWSAAAAPAQSVQLADGRVLLAEVEAGSVTGDGMRVRRLDNGGVLDLRWDHLSPLSAHEWKKRFDLAGDQQEELTVRAEEVEYFHNGSKQTVLGRITHQPDAVVVEVKGIEHRIKRTDLVSTRPVDVPVMQVLTKEQFYNEQLATTQPGQDADKHVLLAKTLLRVRDLERAKEHAETAKKLPNSKNPAEIDALLAQVQRLTEAAKEDKLLADITAARSRGRLEDFEKGKKLVAQFEKEFPNAKLKTEFEAERRRFQDARTRFLTGQVAEKFRDAIRSVSERAIADPALSLANAREYAMGKMTDDIVARVVQQLRLEADEVKQLWSARKDNAIGKRSEHFYYGTGSWVLGDKDILKNTEQGKANDKRAGAKPEGASDNAEIERLRRVFAAAKERRRAQVSGDASARELTDEGWWRQAERLERVNWLRAYYAEYGGQLVVTYATVTPCISCYGEGNVLDMGPEGKPIRNKCYLCQGTKFVRSFKAY